MRNPVYHTEQQRDEAASAAACWGSGQHVTIEEVLLVAERMLAEAGKRLATEYDLTPGPRYDLTVTADRLSREVETLRNRLDEDLADLARINRERERHERRRCQDHAAAVADTLPAHLMDLGEGMLRALREEGR